MLSSYCKLSFILFLILNIIVLGSAYSPTTETNPLKYDTQFSFSLNSFTSESVIEQGAIIRYSDAYGKATTFFRNQYGIDISGNGTRLPPGCELFTGSTSDYVVNYARVRGFPILAGGQDVGVHDDTISIRINQPTVLNGVFGKNGALVESNSILYFGFYTFFWRNNGSSVFPRIIYSGMMPLRFDSNSSMINFQLTSTLFGQGYARGSTMIRKDQSGRVYTSIIISQTFQMSISDFSPKCSVITSETDIFNENFVIKWNNVLLSIIRDLKVVPPVAARQLAILHLAIDESLVECKNLTERNCTHPTMVSLISHAASRVLKKLYSSQLDCINAALKSALECNDCKGLSMGYLERIGKPGIVAADRVLNSRESDGCNDFVNYEFDDGSMYYQSHAPNFNRIPLLPHWSLVKPFVIQNVSLFDQGPPPSINSPLFERDYNETFQYGKEDSQVRTLEQTKIALFWADGAGTSTPPGHWLNILKTIIRNRNVKDTLQISSLFKALTVTMADAAIVCWHHKYKYNAFRPITAFTESERVSNWSPLIATPPFPEYSSGHSTISAAAARILSLLFESNEISFESTSEGLIHTIRKFNNLFDAAKEAGKSRIYGGIHFDYANQAGLISGENIANAIHNTLLHIKVQ